MPQMIQYVDAIARQKQRDVLYLVFGARTVREYMHEASAEDGADGDFFDTLDEWECNPPTKKHQLKVEISRKLLQGEFL